MNVLSAYKRHCDTVYIHYVVNSECYIEDLYRVLHHTMCPTDSEGVQVDDIDWSTRYENYDHAPHSYAHEEVKKTITNEASNWIMLSLCRNALDPLSWHCKPPTLQKQRPQA
jgi:hypothetical protein